MEKNYEVNPRSQNLSIQTLEERIDDGYKLQEIKKEELFGEEKLMYNDAIIIAPDYQREYRFRIKDESSLIESVLVGIPIPPVFLANTRFKGVQVLNVVDGQHRLRAFNRYMKNKFKLKGLTLKKDLNGKYYDELEINLKEKILSYELSAIVFRNFPGKEFELEIFKRYNKGTKPLKDQEIRHAVYDSKFNRYINSFARKLLENDENIILSKAYNATKNRFQKKKLQENLFVILNILENGINTSYKNSTYYAEKFMEEKSALEEKAPDEFNENFKQTIEIFESFNELVKEIGKKIEFPFSKEIYGIVNRNYKFQISLGMIIAGIYNKIYFSGHSPNNLKQEEKLNKFCNYLEQKLVSSFLEDPEYNASSTDSNQIQDLIDEFNISLFFEE